MCRKNLLLAAVLAAFGVGILVGGWIEWHFIRTLLALGAIALGFLLSGGNRWHK